MTSLYTVAEQVGANRILVPGSKFHYPFGKPELSKEAEYQWRKQAILTALDLLARPVTSPTIVYAEE